MSKENVISKKEPFARMVKRDHISVDHLEKERISGCTEGTEAERGSGKIFPAGGITAMSPDHYHRRNQDRCSDADGSRNSGNRLCAASRSCLP